MQQCSLGSRCVTNPKGAGRVCQCRLGDEVVIDADLNHPACQKAKSFVNDTCVYGEECQMGSVCYGSRCKCPYGTGSLFFCCSFVSLFPGEGNFKTIYYVHRNGSVSDYLFAAVARIEKTNKSGCVEGESYVNEPCNAGQHCVAGAECRAGAMCKCPNTMKTNFKADIQKLVTHY